PDYSLLPDTEFPERLDWMYEKDYTQTENLTPHQKKTLLALREKNQKQLQIAKEMRHQLLKNAAEIQVAHNQQAKIDQPLAISVAVTNKVAGHNFPTGFSAERQLWVHLEVFDPTGKKIFASGDLDHNGDLRDEHSHEVLLGKANLDKHLWNFQNKFTALTNKGTERSVTVPVNRHLSPVNVVRPATGISAALGKPGTFRISKASIPPLTTLRKEYPVSVSKAGIYKVSASLKFRHLPPALLDKIGIPHFKPLLEIVTIDEQESYFFVNPKE
ncbi:MAG: hypothetical protein MPJ24_10815, partial [Pirellulaceae bacterium]|nr:hypothetical protein [Pirellulaceae bacterium]